MSDFDFVESLAPVTWRIGFLRAPVSDVADAFYGWWQDLGGAEREDLPGGLVENVRRLEPLTNGVRPRELVVATANREWTAVFDCGVRGGDPVSRVGHMSRTMTVSGVVVTLVPDLPVNRASQAGVQLEIYAPFPTGGGPLNYVRTISVTQDGRKWRFDANGTVQDFEDVEAYQRRRVADRFTAQMLAEYAEALGLRPFDEDFYPGPSALLTHKNDALLEMDESLGVLRLSLADARRHWGLE